MMERTTTASVVLGMLTLGPASGYGLKARIEASLGGFWGESFGQIYPALVRLEEGGLVFATGGGEHGKRGRAARRVYEITEPGREQVKAWLKLAPRPSAARDELLLKIVLGASSDIGSMMHHLQEASARAGREMERHEEARERVRLEHRDDPSLTFRFAAIEYMRAEATMRMNWCDTTYARLWESTRRR